MVERNGFSGLAAKLAPLADLTPSPGALRHRVNVYTIRPLHTDGQQGDLETANRELIYVSYSPRLGFQIVRHLPGEETVTEFVVNRSGKVIYFDDSANKGESASKLNPLPRAPLIHLKHPEGILDSEAFVRRKIDETIEDLTKLGEKHSLSYRIQPKKSPTRER